VIFGVQEFSTRRNQHLVQLLGRWKTTPPFSAAAARQDKTAAKYVKQAKEKADKRLHEADDDVERLHRACNAAKRWLPEPGFHLAAHSTWRPNPRKR
jgi:hypothetical protein